MGKADFYYSFKPLVTTFFPGIVHKCFYNSKLFLDVEDNDIKIDNKNFLETLRLYIRGWRSIVSYKYNKWLDIFLGFCDQKTVSSKKLQNFYNGKILRVSTVDEDYKFSQEFGDKLKLYFCGNLKDYKGLKILKELVVGDYFNKNLELHLIGDDKQATFLELNSLSKNVFLAGIKRNIDLYNYINKMNVLVALQEDNYYTQAQIPAKIIEALCCGKPIITTEVGDLKEIVLENQNCGWVIKGNNIKELVKIIKGIDYSDIELKSKNCREKYNLEFSKKHLKKFFDDQL